MKGLLFVHLQEVGPGAMNIRTGIVKSQLGNSDRYLLEFQGANYRFANVFSSEQLERFAFFNTQAEQAAFIAELQAGMQGAQSKTDDAAPPAGVKVDAPSAPSPDVPPEA